MRRSLIWLVLALALIGSAAAAPADGTYEVRLPGSGGRCTLGLVIRLTVVQGRLSGILVGGAAGTQTIDTLVLKPDGSFTGTTSGATGGPRGGVPWAISGQFSGNAVTVSATGGRCGTLTGQG